MTDYRIWSDLAVTLSFRSKKCKNPFYASRILWFQEWDVTWIISFFVGQLLKRGIVLVLGILSKCHRESCAAKMRLLRSLELSHGKKDWQAGPFLLTSRVSGRGYSIVGGISIEVLASPPPANPSFGIFWHFLAFLQHMIHSPVKVFVVIWLNTKPQVTGPSM